MVCGLSFVNDDTVAFSYSLPRVFVERRTGDNVNLAFYNEPVILSWQVEPFRTLPLTDLAAALQDTAYMNQYFAIYPYDGQYVAMACQQLTYPLFSVPPTACTAIRSMTPSSRRTTTGPILMPWWSTGGREPLCAASGSSTT